MATKTKGFFKKLLSSVLSAATVFTGTAMMSTAVLSQSAVPVKAAGGGDASTFSWDNATVYFLLTDRFCNGDPSNDNAYGRMKTVAGDNRATFHGGDFAGITKKINEGYFDDLGVTAIWLTAPYEQLNGYILGDNFAHYSYHGYYVTDYTETDDAYGSKAEFQTMVDTAHEHGIRIVMDIVMNHAGYNNMIDMYEYNYGTLLDGWKQTYESGDIANYHKKIDYKSSAEDWGRWWGTSWVRSGLPGYNEQGDGPSEQTQCLTGLPDFRTESTAQVSIPQFLQTKWQKEGTLSEKMAKYGSSNTVTGYISTWLAEWVETYGIDGFRCDTAKHVDKGSWKQLKDKCVAALRKWKQANPSKKLDDLDFWMTGEHWGWELSSPSDAYFTEGGFDSMINFQTQGGGMVAEGRVAGTYADYASRINSSDNFNALSYLSSHDSTLARPGDMYALGSAFLLLPGAVQIYYGDETARGFVQGIPNDGGGGAGHSLRSDMPWDSLDTALVKHWGIVGRFRKNHISIGAGSNAALTASSGVGFGRTYSKNGIEDKAAGVIYASANTDVSVDVSAIWPDGTMLTNFYDDSSATVSGGKVTFNSGAHGTILICEPDGSKGVVKVKHIDQASGETLKEETLSGLVGDSYTAQPLSKPGFTVSKTEGSKTGTFSETPATVTFYYAFDSANYAYITVKHVDASTGAELAASTTEAAKIGASFTAVPADIKDYELDPAKSDNATITVKSGTNTITFKYNYVEPSNAKVHYYNANGWSSVNMYAYTGDGATAVKLLGAWPGKAMTAESDGWFVCDVPDTESCRVLFNAGPSGPQEPAAEVPGYEVTGEVWIKNAKVQTASKVNVMYVSTDGTTLGTATLKGISGDTYKAEEKTFSGYTLTETPANATGTFGSSTITVTFTYKPDKEPVPETLVNTSTISATSIAFGKSVTMTGSCTGGSGTKLYAGWYKLSTDSAYTTIRDYSTTSTFTVTPKKAGTYSFVIRVKDGAGANVRKEFSVKVTQGLTNTSTISATSVALGKSVTMTGSCTGGSGTKLYAGWYKLSSDSAYTTIRNYSTTNTFTVTPKKTGTYSFVIRVKDGAGANARKEFSVQVTNAPLTNTSTISATSIALGKSVTMTGSCTGGSGTKLYAGWYKLSSDSAYTTIRNYSTTNTFTVTPKKTGTYSFVIRVKDGAGSNVRKEFSVKVTQSLTNTSTISKTTIAVGNYVIVNCSAKGGTGTKKYQVWYKRSSVTDWTMAQDYDTNTTVKIYPKHADKYTISIKVKDGSGKVVTKRVSLTVNKALSNTSKVSSTKTEKDKAITITLSSTGGVGTKKYAVWYKRSTASSWTQKQSYSTNTKLTFTPKNTGKYYISTKVKDTTGKIVKKAFTITVYAPLANTSKLSASSISYGSSVTVNCSSTGGTGTKKYAIWYKRSTVSDWTKAQDYSTNTSKKITPKHTGTYTVSIKVKDGSGKIVGKRISLTVKSSALVNTSTVSATAIVKGNSFKVNCSSTGGTGTKKYAVYYKRADSSSWTTKQDYSTNTTVTIKPAAATVYDVCVKVKDGNGTVSKMYKTVCVNTSSSSFKNTSTISSTSVSKGTKVVITGSSSYANDMAMYKYEYKTEGASSYTTIKDYTTSTTASFTPSSSGRYFVRVLALDMTPTTKVKTFTVTVK